MRRTLLSTTTTTSTIIVILIAVSWLSETPVRGFPTGSRRTLDPSSARRRDDLIAGSDFLDMFIGASVAPSARSRRFPISRSSAELRNRFYRERNYPSGVMTQFRNHPSDSHRVAEQTEKVTGLASALDRQSVQHKFGRVPSQGEQRTQGDKTLGSLQQENSAEQDVRDAEGAGFGSRTVPRSQRVVMSASSELESAAPNGEISNAYRHRDSEEMVTIPVSVISSDDDASQRKRSSAYQVIPNVNRVPVRGTNTIVSPRFSVSSSVQKITYKTEQKKIRDRTVANTQRPLTTSNLFSSTSIEPVDTEDFEMQDASKQDIQFTGASLSTTDSNAFTTVDDVSTVTTTVESETTTESTDDWSTKADTFTTTSGEDKLPSESTEAPAEEDLAEEVPDQVISVRVSSSVGQYSLTSQSQEQQSTDKPYSSNESHSSGLPDYEDASEAAEAEEASLVTEEQPHAEYIQRSELSVEESLPSEVTTGPQGAYSRLQAPRANHYQNSPDEATTDTDSSASSYQPTATTNAGRSRLFGFGKPPGYRRSFTSVRRAAADASVEDASVVETSQRRFAPRFAAERSSPRAQSKEPVSVAESIQRSVIANQDVDGDDTRRGQYQDKAGYGDQLKNEEDDVEGFGDDENKFENGRARKSFQPQPLSKSYSQPERIYGRPEKVYGEPEKVYGEPEKVYGEPAKVYGEPAKIYGEPAKVYGEPSKVYSEPAKVYSEPAKVYSEPAKVYSEPAKVYGEPSKVYGEPSKVYGEPSKNYGVPEENYEVDESVSVQTNGRAHGVQPQTPAPGQMDNDMKVFDTRQQDPNHKFGYVVEGRDYRKYRVEERTSDGFIVGEYGVVSNDGGNLRGVRYTADGTINPRLIYDTLLKFLSL